MGSYVSRRAPDGAAGKVVLSDGTVQVFADTMSVAELMLEYPHQFVIELRSLLAGNRARPLPADHKLDPDSVYMMLPMKRGKAAAPSAGEAHRLLSRARSILRSGSFLPSSSASGGAPFTKMTTWAPEEDASEEEEEEEDGKAKEPVFSAEVFAEAPGCLRRQLSGRPRGWKPSLHTIEERALQKKVPHWLF